MDPEALTDADRELILALHGWLPDTSPETENSNHRWYRHEATLELKREDELVEELC